MAWVVESTWTCRSWSSLGVVAMITPRVTMTDRPATIAIGPAILARGVRVIRCSPIHPDSQCGDDVDTGRNAPSRRRGRHGRRAREDPAPAWRVGHDLDLDAMGIRELPTGGVRCAIRRGATDRTDAVGISPAIRAGGARTPGDRRRPLPRSAGCTWPPARRRTSTRTQGRPSRLRSPRCRSTLARPR